MKYIKLNNDEMIEVIEIRAGIINGRSCLSMTFESDYATLKEKFTEGVQYSVVADEQTDDGENTQAEYDKSDYCLPIKFTDNCNGKFEVIMGKKTATELLEEENAQLMFELLTGEEF